MGYIIGQVLMKLATILAEKGAGVFLLQCVTFGGKTILVTVKVVGGAIVALTIAHEVFGF